MIPRNGPVRSERFIQVEGEMNPTEDEISEVTIRPFRRDDISFAMEVKNLAGWNQTERDWEGYLSFEPDGCFIAEAGGRKVGTATTIRYADRFGWIGMVLVHPEARRLGIGTKLLHAAIAYLRRRGVNCVKLDATPVGRKVYAQIGFQDEYGISRYEGTAPVLAEAPASAAVQLLTEADLPKLVAADVRAFGAERERVMRSLSGRNPELCFVRREAGRVAGYLVARQGMEAVQVGPWIAENSTSAGELWRALLHRVRGDRVFVDVPHPNAAGTEIVRDAGFVVQRGFTRMFLGQNAHAGHPEWVFGTSSAEKG